MPAMFNLLAFFRRGLFRRCNCCGTRGRRADMLHQTWSFWYCNAACSQQDWADNAW